MTDTEGMRCLGCIFVGKEHKCPRPACPFRVNGADAQVAESAQNETGDEGCD